MPDGIANYTVGGQTYYVTANEGDARDLFGDEARASSVILDPSNPALGLQGANDLGRLNISNIDGDTDGDGDFDALFSYGSRSFTIFDAEGNVVFDSGDDFEQLIALNFPDFFNSDNTDNTSLDNRSDNKGPEPEGVVVGQIDGKIYAFIGLERQGGVIVYDVTNPAAATFVDYINTRDFTAVEDTSAAGDLGPKGLAFISAKDSPIDQPLLAVSNEISGTTRIYKVEPDVLHSKFCMRLTSKLASTHSTTPRTSRRLWMHSTILMTTPSSCLPATTISPALFSTRAVTRACAKNSQQPIKSCSTSPALQRSARVLAVSTSRC